MTVQIKIKDESQSILASIQKTGDHALVFEGNLYFNPEQVDFTYLKKTERIYRCPYKGVAYWYDLDAPNMKAKNIAWVYENPDAGYEQIKNKIGFYSRETSATVAEND